MARTSTAEAILALATEMREGNAQLVAWLQQSSERQERQNQSTIAALGEISKGQERIAQMVTEGTRLLANMLLESQALTARTLELTRDIHTRTTGGGSGTTH
jgi:hypothetical protein